MSLATFAAKAAARVITGAIKLRGTRIVVTRPWSGGEQIIFDGEFDGVVFERVHDHRGFVFFVQAKPKLVSDKFLWATPATRPQMIDFKALQFDERHAAWVSKEPL